MNRYERLNEERKIIDTRKRVAAYCRVSTDNEDQANSFESQQRYFKQYIERNPDWELYEIFADEGISGTSTKKRKEFNRMIACAKNGDFDLIITKEISRFARNTLDSIYYTRDLKKHGVGVIFLNDSINTLDGDAELRLAIMSSIAQEESRKTSERVKWGQKRQMEQGVVFGRSMLGYDVKDGKMTINEEGAKIVRLIFHKFVNEGKGTHVIARELREEGILPCRVKEWQNTVILRVIRNEKYCGDLVQKKTYTPDFLSHEKKYNRGQEEFVIIKDHHEPIVSRELFEEAKALVEKGINPIGFPGLKLSITSDDSKAINFDQQPKVILSASGMCEAGRIRHHLKHNLWRPESTIVFVGYQTRGTLGRALLEGAKEVKLFGEVIEVKAEITKIAGISGHADKNGLLKWINSFTEKPPKRVFVVHGEDKVCDEFARTLTDSGYNAVAPYSGTVFDLIQGEFVKEALPVAVKKKAAAKKRSGDMFQRLLTAGQRLISVIRKNEGLSNKDTAKFTDQIQALCDKWDRP